MNRELESILLSENEDNLEKVNAFLEADYKDTLREIFTVLLENIKKSSIDDIETIMYNIEQIILKQDIKNHKFITNAVKEANYKLNEIKHYSSDTEFKHLKFRLVDLNRKISAIKEKVTNSNLYNFYHYLVFEEKNLDIVSAFLNNERNILSKKDEYGNNLFYNIIDHYCSLKEDDEDIKYFYEVILLFLKSEENKLIKEDRLYYLTLLNRKFCKNKESVKQVIDRFEDFYLIDAEVLEKRYNVSSKAHESVISELKEMKLNYKGRKIFTDNFITIDDEDAMCLDDALSLVKNKDGSYNFYIAISDIPSLVPYESFTYYAAMKQVETLYLCDKHISLYPDIISDNMCSLLPKVYRNAIVYKVLVDPSYNVDPDSLEIIKGVIRSNYKLTYDVVNHGIGLSDENLDMINNLTLIALKLKNQNKVKEKYRKIENLINANAKHHQSFFTDVSASANIVQESMLLVNSLAPRYFNNNNLVYLYRNHKISNDLFIEQELERIFNGSHTEIDGVEQKRIFNIIKETYLSAYYSEINIGHQGLNYDFYSHSSSAARRFSDSFVQYLTYMQVFDKNITDKKLYELQQITKEVAEHINMKKKENANFANEYNYLNGKKLLRKR